MVRAPLRMLTIRTINPEDLHWTPSALETFLPPFARTLEKLELRDFFIDITDVRGLDGSPPSQSTPPLTQYPAVRSLSVRFLEGIPFIDVLQYLFPALDGTLCLDEWGKTTFLSSFEHIRTTNQEAQQRQGNSMWKKLDHLICEPALFYILGLRCPIGLLMIKDCTEEMADDLAMALSENPVPRLKLSLILDPALRVLDALPSAALENTLTHLTLCVVDIRVNEDVHDADGMTPMGSLRWEDILDGIRASLEPLRNLSHLRIVVHCNFFDDTPEPVAPLALRQCEAVGIEGFAASLVRMLPSLRFFFFTMSAWFGNTVDVKDRWHVVRAWHVVDSPANDTGAGQMQDGRQILVDLTDEAAATIIQKEELLLSDVEEIELQIPKD